MHSKLIIGSIIQMHYIDNLNSNKIAKLVFLFFRTICIIKPNHHTQKSNSLLEDMEYTYLFDKVVNNQSSLVICKLS